VKHWRACLSTSLVWCTSIKRAISHMWVYSAVVLGALQVLSRWCHCSSPWCDNAVACPAVDKPLVPVIKPLTHYCQISLQHTLSGSCACARHCSEPGFAASGAESPVPLRTHLLLDKQTLLNTDVPAHHRLSSNALILQVLSPWCLWCSPSCWINFLRHWRACLSTSLVWCICIKRVNTYL
jgi:hypothetical protein